MTQDEYNEFCATLPHVMHVVQWGGADVWKVGTEGKNKLFAVGGWRSAERQRGKGDRPPAGQAAPAQRSGQGPVSVSELKSYGITFKTGEIAFEMLRDAEGCQPAPYLASRGMKWIMRTGAETVSDADINDYLRESHRLASLNLTKKLQKELGLNQGMGDER